MNTINNLKIESFELIKDNWICYAKKGDNIVAVIFKTENPVIEISNSSFSYGDSKFTNFYTKSTAELKFEIKEENNSYFKLIEMKNLDELEGFKKALKTL